MYPFRNKVYTWIKSRVYGFCSDTTIKLFCTTLMRNHCVVATELQHLLPSSFHHLVAKDTSSSRTKLFWVNHIGTRNIYICVCVSVCVDEFYLNISNRLSSRRLVLWINQPDRVRHTHTQQMQFRRITFSTLPRHSCKNFS